MDVQTIVKLVTNICGSVTAVGLVVFSFIKYLSCDSCKAKRLQKVAKLLEKISKINK